MLELMVVVAIIAVSAALVMVALPRGEDTALAQEAARVSAALEGARARSRASGVPWIWQAGADGWFVSNGQERFTVAWRTAGTTASTVPALGQSAPATRTTPTLVLGPEPIVGPQRLRLSLGEQEIWVGTDGVRPFDVLPGPAGAAQ